MLNWLTRLFVSLLPQSFHRSRGSGSTEKPGQWQHSVVSLTPELCSSKASTNNVSEALCMHLLFGLLSPRVVFCILGNFVDLLIWWPLTTRPWQPDCRACVQCVHVAVQGVRQFSVSTQRVSVWVVVMTMGTWPLAVWALHVFPCCTTCWSGLQMTIHVHAWMGIPVVMALLCNSINPPHPAHPPHPPYNHAPSPDTYVIVAVDLDSSAAQI